MEKKCVHMKSDFLAKNISENTELPIRMRLS